MLNIQKNPKTELLTIRISEHEKALIREISAQYGEGMSEIIRMLITREGEKIGLVAGCADRTQRNETINQGGL